MMWKTLIFLTLASAVLAGRIRKHHANYKFYIKHDYNYGHHEKHEHKHHNEEVEHHEEDKENEQPVQQEQQEDNNNSEQNEVQEQNDGKEEEEKEQEEKKEQEEEHEQGEVNVESHKPENHEEYDYPAYEYIYKVHDPYTHDMKGLHEKKYGDEVNGAYWLMQPDGYKRIVKYHANKHSGFLAEVDYVKPEEHQDDEEHHDHKTDQENHAKEENEDHEKPTSEYLMTAYHGLKKPISVQEEVNEKGKDEKESAK